MDTFERNNHNFVDIMMIVVNVSLGVEKGYKKWFN